MEEGPDKNAKEEPREEAPLFSRLPRRKRMRYTRRAGH